MCSLASYLPTIPPSHQLTNQPFHRLRLSNSSVFNSHTLTNTQIWHILCNFRGFSILFFMLIGHYLCILHFATYFLLQHFLLQICGLHLCCIFCAAFCTAHIRLHIICCILVMHIWSCIFFCLNSLCSKYKIHIWGSHFNWPIFSCSDDNCVLH